MPLAKTSTDLKTAITQAFPKTELSDDDITILAFYVVAEASSAAQIEMKSIADEIDKMKDQQIGVQKTLEGKEQQPATMSKVRAIGPSDYYRAPSALAADAPLPQLVQRRADLGAMSDANQTRVHNLMSQKLRFDTRLSSMFTKIAQSDLSTLQSLK